MACQSSRESKNTYVASSYILDTFELTAISSSTSLSISYKYIVSTAICKSTLTFTNSYVFSLKLLYITTIMPTNSKFISAAIIFFLLTYCFSQISPVYILKITTYIPQVSIVQFVTVTCNINLAIYFPITQTVQFLLRSVSRIKRTFNYGSPYYYTSLNIQWFQNYAVYSASQFQTDCFSGSLSFSFVVIDCGMLDYWECLQQLQILCSQRV